MQELLALYEAWASGPDEAAQAEIWQRMLAIHAEQVFTIGLLGAVRQPVVANAGLRNLPEAKPSTSTSPAPTSAATARTLFGSPRTSNPEPTRPASGGGRLYGRL